MRTIETWQLRGARLYSKAMRSLPRSLPEAAAAERRAAGPAASLVLLLLAALSAPALGAGQSLEVLYRQSGNRVTYLLFLDAPCPLNLSSRVLWRRASAPGLPDTAVGCWSTTAGAAKFSHGRYYRVRNAIIVLPAAVRGGYVQQEEPLVPGLWHFGQVTADGKLSGAPWPERALRLLEPMPLGGMRP